MSGTKISATPNMILSVNWLEDASQIVKLAFGIMLEGMMNGNVAIPYVSNTQAMVSAEDKNTNPFLFKLENKIVNKGNKTPKAGTTHNIG